MHHYVLPDGYRWTGRTDLEIALIDPEVCPAGHPVELVRRGYDGRTWWLCACGQEIRRQDGAFFAS